jgi:colanic acid/amylovoran biosynthesis glycosyltransferase
MSSRPTGENSCDPHVGYVLKRFPCLSETFVADELLEFQRRGVPLTVFAMGRPEEPFVQGFLDELSVPVVYLPYRVLREPIRVVGALRRVLRSSPRRWLGAAVASVRRTRLFGWRRLMQATVLRDETARAGVQHMHVHFANKAARLADLAQRMGGPTYSVTAHAKDIYHRQVRARDLREILGRAHFIATVSEENRRYLGSVLEGRRPVHLVSNSVDLERLGRPDARRPEPALVLTVARLFEKKGLIDLIEACALLAEESVPVRLELIGDGPMRQELEAAAVRAGIEVSFLGSLPREEVLGHYRRAAVFCLPSTVASSGDRDGLPTSVLEAMALGVPVVTTALNGLAEAVIDGRTGLAVPERSPRELAAAIRRLLSDPELAAGLSQEARRHVEASFSLANSASRLQSLFRGVS